MKLRRSFLVAALVVVLSVVNVAPVLAAEGAVVTDVQVVDTGIDAGVMPLSVETYSVGSPSS